MPSPHPGRQGHRAGGQVGIDKGCDHFLFPALVALHTGQSEDPLQIRHRGRILCPGVQVLRRVHTKDAGQVSPDPVSGQCDRRVRVLHDDATTRDEVRAVAQLMHPVCIVVELEEASDEVVELDVLDVDTADEVGLVPGALVFGADSRTTILPVELRLHTAALEQIDDRFAGQRETAARAGTGRVSSKLSRMIVSMATMCTVGAAPLLVSSSETTRTEGGSLAFPADG
jgi:hypothetical protein